MDIAHIIPITAYSLIAILILVNYIAIKKPYNYLTVLFIILPAIIAQTPIIKKVNRDLELLLGTLYFVIAMIIVFSYLYKTKNQK